MRNEVPHGLPQTIHRRGNGTAPRGRDRASLVLPDWSRRCPAVDPDNHHLFVSLGCAVENLLRAALANGVQGTSSVDADGVVRIGLEPTRALATPLFAAIPRRQCTRAEFDGRPLSKQELKLLEAAGTGPGVRVLLLTAREALENVLEVIIQGNGAQMGDPASIRELKTWIRFSADEAIRTRDRLFTGASGNPAVPRWLGSPLFDLLFTRRSENKKYARQVRSSSGIAIFVAPADDPAHWLEVGRCDERFALQAAALGLRNAMVNQPVEVPALRPQLASFLGVGGLRPDLVVRFGRGPALPPSLGRPVAAVVA